MQSVARQGTRRRRVPGANEPDIEGRLPRRLLMFNLALDESDPVLGFTATWVRAIAGYVDALDLVTNRASPASLPAHVNVYSLGKERGHGRRRRLTAFYCHLARLLR